jgi:hypothetical protein
MDIEEGDLHQESAKLGAQLRAAQMLFHSSSL